MNGLFEKGDAMNRPIECFVYDPERRGFPVKPHWHYFAEFIYILDGEAEVRSGEDTYLLGEGDLMIFHPETVHSIYAAGENIPKFIGLKFDLNRFERAPAYAPKMKDIFRAAQQTKMQVHFPSDEAETLECERIFMTCAKETREFRYGFYLVLQSHIYTLLMNIIRCWLDKGMVIDGRGISREEDLELENITRYIDASLSEDLRVSDIAEKCHLSYSCFAKKFQQQHGISCKQYIERMRIFKVEEFLVFTDYDLNYICQETGFSDCSHLIKTFKKHKGVTPKQFRMSRQKKEASAPLTETG